MSQRSCMVDEEILSLSADDAKACQTEIEALGPGPLPNLENGDTYRLWVRDRQSAAYRRLLDKLALRFRQPVTDKKVVNIS